MAQEAKPRAPIHMLRPIFRTLGAPEACRGIGLTEAVREKTDIWSFGGVASEALVWSIHGNEGRLEYQQRRREETDKTPLRGGYHEGCFHDQQGRLTVVDQTHAELGQNEDDTVKWISELTLERMLQADHDQRWPADELLRAWRIFQKSDPERDRLAWGSRPLTKLLNTPRPDPPSARDVLFGRSSTEDTASRDSYLVPMARDSYNSWTIPDRSASISSRYRGGSVRDGADPLAIADLEGQGLRNYFNFLGERHLHRSITHLDDLTAGTGPLAYSPADPAYSGPQPGETEEGHQTCRRHPE